MSVSKDEKRGTWTCSIWYRDWQGQRKHTTKRGFERKKDAEQYERDFLNKQQRQNPTIAFVIDEYKKELKSLFQLNTIKESTFETKIRIIDNYIAPYFGKMEIGNITASNITKWMAHLSTHAQQRERLGSSTIKMYRSILNQLFTFAQKNYGLAANPIALTKPPKLYSNDTRAKYWTLEQYQQFYLLLPNEQLRLLFNVIFWAGLRIGEALALTPSDITPYKLRITKSMMHLQNKPDRLAPPKNHFSIRTTEIPKYLYHQLADYISTHQDITDKQLLFDGITQSKARQILNKYATKADLPRISPHILRHSYASLLYATSHDITAVAAQIGHGDTNTTFKFYAHMLPGSDRAAVDRYEEMALKAVYNLVDNSQNSTSKLK